MLQQRPEFVFYNINDYRKSISPAGSQDKDDIQDDNSDSERYAIIWICFDSLYDGADRTPEEDGSDDSDQRLKKEV